MPSRYLAVLGLTAFSTLLPAQTTPSALKAAPVSVAFSYQEGDAKLPASQTVAVSGPAAAAITASASGSAPWLTVTPLSGTVPASLKVLANPTSLPVGSYSAAITITTSGSSPQSVTVAVTLTVKAAPAALTLSPAVVSFTYTRGGAALSPVSMSLATSGGVLSYTASVAGATWLSVSPKSGIVFPAFSGSLSITANPAGLAPGSYRGTVTIAAPQAFNKSQAVTVNLVVQAGTPAVSSLWPASATQGAAATTITLRGSNLFAGSVVKAGTTDLATTVVGPEVATALLPADLLGAAGSLSIVVSNPGAGGGDSNSIAFTVQAAAPAIAAVVNAASFAGGAVAPGELVAIFGSYLGPPVLATFALPSFGGRIATVLEDTQVLFGSVAAPVVFTSARQLAVLVPYSVAGSATVAVKVSYQGVESAAVTVPVAASAPGLFTALGTGAGQAAAFNFDETTSALSVNADNAPGVKGGVVVLYATGEGVTAPVSLDGQIVAAASSTPNPALSVQIGGAAATVLYSGGVVGLAAGIIQINVRVPAGITASKATPVVLTVNGVPSAAGTTISLK